AVAIERTARGRARAAGAIEALVHAVARDVVRECNGRYRFRKRAVVHWYQRLAIIGWTQEDRDRLLRDLRIDADADGHAEIDLPVQVSQFQVRQQEGRPAPTRSDVVIRRTRGIRVAVDVAGRQPFVRIVIRVHRQADLLEVVRTL